MCAFAFGIFKRGSTPVGSPVIQHQTEITVTTTLPERATSTLAPALSAIDPRMRWFWALSYGIVFLIVGVLTIVSSVLTKSPWLWFIAPVTIALVILGSWKMSVLAYQRFGYALLDDGIWIQSGVIWRKVTFVPRQRIQHTDVTHGPIDRKLGLAKLVIHTAGIRIENISIPGLSDEGAHALRDALLRRDQSQPAASASGAIGQSLASVI